MQYEKLTPALRSAGQRSAVIANLSGTSTVFVMTGAMMMLFASDVLGFSASRISQVLAVAPLLALVRFLFLPWVRRLGYVRTVLVGDAIRLAVAVTLLVLPTRLISFSVYLLLLFTFTSASQLAIGAAWQPLMRDITTRADRGRFFSRMRFGYTLVAMIVTGMAPLLVGDQVTELQYKLLLLIPIVGIINRILRVRQIPELQHVEEPRSSRRPIQRMLTTIRTAPLLRRPLLIYILVQLSLFPLLPVYLRQVLNVPASLVSIFPFAVTLGTALSLLLFGRIADSLGAKPLLIGVLVIASVASPLYLLIPPMGGSMSAVLSSGPTGAIAIVVLALVGLLTGVVNAGWGLGLTSMQHSYVSAENSLDAMNAYASIAVLAASAYKLALGAFIDAVPHEALVSVGGGLVTLDAVKVYLLAGALLFRVAAVVLLRKEPNRRPNFGVADFFSALSVGSIRTMLVERRVGHENERARLDAVRRLGSETTPLSIDPLLESLEDPDYDVRVEAIRTLGYSRSAVAGARLLEILDGDEMGVFADHVAWALGETRYARATKALVERLNDDRYGPRLRSAAARALAKIGDRDAAGPIATALRTETREYVRSAYAVALIQLGGPAEFRTVLEVSDQINPRTAEQEIMFHLCRRLDLPATWLLRLPPRTGSRVALLEYTNRQSSGWREARARIIDAIQKRDVKQIAELAASRMATSAADRSDHAEPADVMTVAEAASTVGSWGASTKIAALWLLENLPG